MRKDTRKNRTIIIEHLTINKDGIEVWDPEYIVGYIKTGTVNNKNSFTINSELFWDDVIKYRLFFKHNTYKISNFKDKKNGNIEIELDR
jgi:hypothetical protein